MGTEYQLTKDVTIDEMSCKFQYNILKSCPNGDVLAECSSVLTADELRTSIIRQIEVLSYFSDDPEAVLKRFNVNYGDQE